MSRKQKISEKKKNLVSLQIWVWGRRGQVVIKCVHTVGTRCARSLFYPHPAFKTDYSLEFFHNVGVFQTNCSAIYSVAVAARCLEDFDVSFFSGNEPVSLPNMTKLALGVKDSLGEERQEKGASSSPNSNIFLESLHVFPSEWTSATTLFLRCHNTFSPAGQM